MKSISILKDAVDTVQRIAVLFDVIDEKSAKLDKAGSGSDCNDTAWCGSMRTRVRGCEWIVFGLRSNLFIGDGYRQYRYYRQFYSKAFADTSCEDAEDRLNDRIGKDVAPLEELKVDCDILIKTIERIRKRLALGILKDVDEEVVFEVPDEPEAEWSMEQHWRALHRSIQEVQWELEDIVESIANDISGLTNMGSYIMFEHYKQKKKPD